MSYARAVTAFALVGIAALAACGNGDSTTPAGGNPATPTPPGTTPPGPGVDAGGDGPATPADAGTAACDRASQTKTAPVALYDAFLADLSTLSTPQARAARADKLFADVAAAGGTPLADPASDRVVFLARGAAPSGAWAVSGAFNAWSASGTPLQVVAGTDVWAFDTKLSRAEPNPYKLLGGSTWLEDPLARNVAWDGIDRGTVGGFNAIARADTLPANKGRLVVHRKVHATALANDRDVFVYLPPKYDDPACTKLPHVVVHDGNESLTRGDFAGAADTLYAARPELSAVLVFVALPDQNVRMDEYTFNTTGAKGDAYGDFLVSDLEPTVSKAYRVCSKASARGISGASLGGLISTYLAFKRPDVWGYVGAQSSSYFWDDDWMITRAGQDPTVPVRIYLDHGCPGDNCEENRAMTQALANKGYDQKHVEAPGAQHDWSYWRARLPELLTWFRDARTDCD